MLRFGFSGAVAGRKALTTYSLRLFDARFCAGPRFSVEHACRELRRPRDRMLPAGKHFDGQSGPRRVDHGIGQCAAQVATRCTQRARSEEQLSERRRCLSAGPRLVHARSARIAGSAQKMRSRFRDLNSRPAVYETAGLIIQTELVWAFSAELFQIGVRGTARCGTWKYGATRCGWQHAGNGMGTACASKTDHRSAVRDGEGHQASTIRYSWIWRRDRILCHGSVCEIRLADRTRIS